ncbi:MAG: response regulator transcription factor [Chloroflexi bacterium]|nr:MAG: response regulator transcription factor [Chloroflexota bacterium]
MQDLHPANGREGEPRFSPRQTEIVSLIASGYSDKQIALTLRVSQRTVRTQLERLYAANRVHSRAQAVHIWALAGRPSSTPPAR